MCLLKSVDQSMQNIASLEKWPATIWYMITRVATLSFLRYRESVIELPLLEEISLGWERILNDACQQIEAYLVQQQRLAPELQLPQIVQIKEKLGSLRINLIPSNDYVSQIRLYALQQSERVCIHCGSPLKWRGIHEHWCSQ